jgi:hypothetical protein
MIKTYYYIAKNEDGKELYLNFDRELWKAKWTENWEDKISSESDTEMVTILQVVKYSNPNAVICIEVV